jgi:hypothetical protein
VFAQRDQQHQRERAEVRKRCEDERVRTPDTVTSGKIRRAPQGYGRDAVGYWR